MLIRLSFLVIVLFLVSCTGNIVYDPSVGSSGDPDNENITASGDNETVHVLDEPPIIETILSEPDNVTDLEIEFPDRNFTLDELFDEINRITDSDYRFKVDNRSRKYQEEVRPEGQDIYPSNRKHTVFVVHTFNDSRIRNASAFNDFVSVDNWEAWRYYYNETVLYWRTLPLTEKELEKVDKDYSYKKYRLVDSDFITTFWDQRQVNTSIGIIPQTIVHGRVFDIYGIWTHNRGCAGTLHIIPCTKNIIIYQKLESGMDTLSSSYTGSTYSELMFNYNSIINKRQPEMTNISEQIMEFCGMAPEMLQDFSIETKVLNETTVWNWKMFYLTKYKFNFTVNSINATMEKKENVINSINLTFTNNENTSAQNVGYYSYYISMEVYINNSGRVDQYMDTFIKGEVLIPGESVTKTYYKDSNIDFEENATMIFKPYFGWPEMGKQYKRYLGKDIIVPIQITDSTPTR